MHRSVLGPHGQEAHDSGLLEADRLVPGPHGGIVCGAAAAVVCRERKSAPLWPSMLAILLGLGSLALGLFAAALQPI